MPFSFHPHGPAAKSGGRRGHPYLIDTCKSLAGGQVAGAIYFQVAGAIHT